jgi:ribosomal protein L34E
VVQYQKKPTKAPRCGATGVTLQGVSSKAGSKACVAVLSRDTAGPGRDAAASAATTELECKESVAAVQLALPAWTAERQRQQ